MNHPFSYSKKSLQPLLLLVLAIVPAFLSAQVSSAGPQYKGADGIQHDLLIDDGKGQPLQIGDHSDIGGTPFFQNDWNYAMIKLADGRSVTDSLVNYSLYNDQLYFKRDDKIYQIQYLVKEFSIESSGAGDKKELLHFQNGFPGIERNDGATFYQVLFAGNNLQLLKWQQKKIREVYHYGGAYESNYTPVHEYFIFYAKEKRMVSLGSKPNVKSLLKELPDMANTISNYSAKNKINTAKDEDLAALFSAADTAQQ